jgi:uncharacterized protein YaiE (UPF0345 family)
MYTNVWAKYLPVIRIVMKRSLVSEQVLALNVQDFERAGLIRKSGYKFQISFKNGKPVNVVINLPLASSLSVLMMEDEGVQTLIANSEFQITMNSKFELNIKHIPSAELVEDTVAE